MRTQAVDERGYGFGGSLADPAERVAEPALRLPRDAVRDGPHLRVPDGRFRTIVVDDLAVGLGELDGLLRVLAERLEPDGRLVLGADHAHARQALAHALGERALHGWRAPALAVSPAQLVGAATRAGFVVEDLVRVPGSDPLPSGAVETLFDHGVRALAWASGPPADRLWLVARRTAHAPLSVLVGPGAAELQDFTASIVQAFAPTGTEIVRCTGDDAEPVAWNRAVARSCGAVVWFVRAGSVASRTLCDDLLAHSAIGPALPHAAHTADLSGLAVAREHALTAGPIGEQWHCPRIAFEDWLLRLEQAGHPLAAVDGLFDSPPPPGPAATGAETRELLAAWNAMAERPNEIPESSVEPDPPPWHGRAPRVSLCMIVRDEERFLDQCLRRAASAVDEIVVVDTGSRDRTVAIARSYGAVVVHEPWADDFAAARNRSLDAATGDWALVLDADELLAEGAAEKLRAAVADPRIAAYHLPLSNAGHDPGQEIALVRLFRRLPGVRFRFRIHEQVLPSLVPAARAAGLRLARLGVAIEHHGYTQEVVDARRKNERNERLFRAACRDDPDEPYLLYKFGDSLRGLPGRGDEAHELLRRALALLFAKPRTALAEVPYAAEVAALCALDHARRDELDRAAEIVALALDRCAPTPNLHYVAAGLALRNGRADVAIRHFRECLAHDGQVLGVPVQRGITSHVAFTGIAQALLQKGQPEPARRLLGRALWLSPDNETATTTLAGLCAQDGDPAAAVQLLTGLLRRRPESEPARQLLAAILARVGRRDEAARLVGT